ncbi:MAG: electron transfer flavoprotein subunit alpha/FixB family protein [Anaerolineales bacterium]
MVASLYGIEQENKAIWVFLEQEKGVLEPVSLELLTKGREMADQIGWSLAGLLLGNNVESLTAQVFSHGADQVYLADHPLLEPFTIEAYSHVVFDGVMDSKPSVFLFGATPNGRDLAARLAVRFRTGLNADCTDLRLDIQGDLLVSEVSGFGGGVLALIEMRHHRPQMATVRPGVFSVSQTTPRQKPRVIPIPVALTEEMIRTRILHRVVGEVADLSRAPILVAGGRGIQNNFEMTQELADIMGGEVGGTRPLVDEGFIPRERQIGQTGVVCSPKLSICLGISGAFHFIVGIDKADTVISINSDPEAPIFEYSDYCIVADANQIIPELIAALRSVEEVHHA